MFKVNGTTDTITPARIVIVLLYGGASQGHVRP